MAPLSPQDLFNIAKIEEGRDKQQIRNLNQITKHNAERALELQSLREDLNFFDWDQCFMEEKLNSNIFHPSFASHITDFDETTKCLACHSFPKCTARGLCKLCRFYVDNGLKSQIVDKNYQSKIEVLEKIDLETMCESALNGIFGFSDFRDGQKDAILSFAQNHDTLVLKQTGGGKKIVARLGINHQKILVICDKYFGNNSIIFQVQKRRDNKEQFLEDILRAINEVEVGKCIIYCASVKGCENLLSDLQDKVAKEIITMYHGELSAKEKSTKTIVMFNRKDIRTVMGIYSGRQERMADNPSFVNVKSNMQKMLEVIDAISKVKQQVSRNDVVDVFRQSQAKDIKNQFGHLPVYQEKFPRILKTKEDAFLLLDDLVLRKLVEEDIVLTRSSAGQTCVCSVSILGLTEDAFAKANNQNWIYLIK
ncbi:2726_t:CDS:2 [Entrophospora sp. SA101]|nr:2726_t:CDS:2 [Entrophospora sp. SA101]